MLPLGASERERRQIGQVWQFPYGEHEAKLIDDGLRCPPPEIPCLETFDARQTREMYGLTSSIVTRAKELVEFVDSNRELAKRVGIETIGIELSGMLEGDRLRQVLDALQLAASRNQAECLTEEGLATLRRAEKLLAEANASIMEHTGIRMERPLDAAVFMGQQNVPQQQPISNIIHNNAGANPSGGENTLIVPMVIIGVVGLAAIIAVIAFTSSRRER